MLAARGGHLSIVENLLQSQASVDLAEASGLTALLLAAQQGHTEVCKLLGSHGASLDARSKGGRSVGTFNPALANILAAEAAARAEAAAAGEGGEADGERPLA